MCRTVWDFPAPVAPVTNACRFSVASGTRNAPTGRSWGSRIAPTSISGEAGPGRSRAFGLAGDVEIAGIEHPQPGNLAAGQPGQRGQRAGRSGERRGRAVGRVLHRDRERPGQAVRLQAAAQPVGVPAQVHRPDQYRSDQPQFLRRGRAGQHAHAPQPGLAERVEFGHPALRALDVEPGMLLLVPAQHVELRAQFGDLGVDQPGGLGDDQPAEPPAHERHERRFEQGRPPVLVAAVRLAGFGQRRCLPAGAATSRPSGPARRASRRRSGRRARRRGTAGPATRRTQAPGRRRAAPRRW